MRKGMFGNEFSEMHKLQAAQEERMGGSARKNGVTLETKRLILRRWASRDFEHYREMCMDTEVMMAAGARPAKNLTEARKQFRHAKLSRDYYAIVLKASNVPVGQIHFQEDIRRYRINSISIGYELSKAYWGKGIMTEALKAMVYLAFQQKMVDVIGIGHFLDNHRSRRVIEKCGFSPEGILRMAYLRYDGAIFDDASYALLRSEYLANRMRYEEVLIEPPF